MCIIPESFLSGVRYMGILSQQAFIEFALEHKVLRFGEFTLKSGRISPYFFNSGLFNGGRAISRLGQFYAQAIIDSGVKFDMLFGPAYKGIPLACSTAIALAEKHGVDVPWCFDRKEVKDHGEGGQLVGAPLQGKVLVIDDVITAGTAINDAVEVIHANAAKLTGVVVGINRQEKGKGEQSAIQEIERRYDINVIAVATLSDIVNFLNASEQLKQFLQPIKNYQNKFGIQVP